MVGEPEGFIPLHVLRDFRERLARTDEKLEETRSLLFSLDKDLANLVGHRTRHEVQFEAIGVRLDQIRRRLGIHDGTD